MNDSFEDGFPTSVEDLIERFAKRHPQMGGELQNLLTAIQGPMEFIWKGRCHVVIAVLPMKMVEGSQDIEPVGLVMGDTFGGSIPNLGYTVQAMAEAVMQRAREAKENALRVEAMKMTQGHLDG